MIYNCNFYYKHRDASGIAEYVVLDVKSVTSEELEFLQKHYPGGYALNMINATYFFGRTAYYQKWSVIEGFRKPSYTIVILL